MIVCWRRSVEKKEERKGSGSLSPAPLALAAPVFPTTLSPSPSFSPIDNTQSAREAKEENRKEEEN
jgi:hypothetical protein